MAEITSAHNPLLQKIRKAVMSGRATPEGLVIAEGPHLLEEAVDSRWQIAQILTTPAGRTRYSDLLQRVDAPVIEASARAFDSAAGTEHSQHMLALLHPTTWTWEDLLGPQALLVVLDGIQDPGNAGAIVRSAEAFGASGVVFLKGSAHIANGKLLRASAGSMFRVPFLEGVQAHELLAQTQHRQIYAYALEGHTARSITQADLRRPLALIVGNEGSGVSPELLAAGQSVRIPTQNVESLNAAVACSVALFGIQQQRATLS